MADTYEQNLGQKSSLTVNDYIRVVGSDNASYKQLVSDVAKKIIESYTGSSLAGSSQSVKSALDALNSKTTEKILLNENSYLYSCNTADTWEDTGISFTLTKSAIVRVIATYYNSPPKAIAISINNSTTGIFVVGEWSVSGNKLITALLKDKTYRIFIKGSTTANAHGIGVMVMGDTNATVTTP